MPAISTGLGIALAAGLGAAGSVASGVIGAGAAGSAASAQANAATQAAQIQAAQADRALQFQRQVWQQQQANQMPWLQTGAGALANLSSLLGIAPEGNMPSFSAQVPSTGPTAITPSSPFGDATSRFQGAPAGLVSPNQIAEPGGPAVRGVLPGGVPATGPGGVPLSSLVNPALGAFGSLSQGWNRPFNAPTAVTEQNDPGYQFRLQEGMRALENSAAARGGLLSGATGKALQNYAQNFASGEYANVYGRALGEYQQAYNIFQQNQANQFNRLASLSGFGQTAAGQLNSAGAGAAGNVSNILLGSGAQIGQDIQNAAAARASGYVGSANAYGGALSGGLGNLSQLLLLRSILNPAGTAPNTGGMVLG